MNLRIGTYLNKGKYRIEKVLGQGSFGITYLATAKFTTKGSLGAMGVEAQVAIKEFFMSEVNSRKPDGSSVEGSGGSVFTNYRRKFRKEAENLSKLEHPGIVNVYDVFDENGTTYYSMEYVDGCTLDEYISQNNPLDEDEAIEIIGHICEALAFMHYRRMLHLDLKPKNIMRSTTGDIYLIDFGLSKQFTSNGEPESSTTIGLGTPGYAPLEQAKMIKDGTFPATLDIYALGATMYKILTGQRPLDASDILNEGFSSTLFDKYNRSEALIQIVEKCMSPMKKDRFQSVLDIIEAYPLFNKLDDEESPEEDTIIRNECNTDEVVRTRCRIAEKYDKVDIEYKCSTDERDNILDNIKEEGNRFLSFISYCLEIMWSPLYTPVVSLTILLFFCDLCGWESAYFDLFSIVAIVCVVIFNICSYICYKSVNDLIRNTCAICSVICISLFLSEFILSFFPETCQYINNTFATK